MEKELVDFCSWLWDMDYLKKMAFNSPEKLVDYYKKSINSVNPNELEAVRQHEGEEKVCITCKHLHKRYTDFPCSDCDEYDKWEQTDSPTVKRHVA